MSTNRENEERDSACSSRQTSQNNEDVGFSFVIEDCGDDVEMDVEVNVEKGERDEGSTSSSQDSALGWRNNDNCNNEEEGRGGLTTEVSKKREN